MKQSGMSDLLKNKDLHSLTAEERLKKEATERRSGMFSLDRIKIWQNRDCWKFADLWTLCQLGIPSDIRPKIWCEMFKIDLIYQEYEDDKENIKISRYLRYLEYVSFKDCASFQQLESDIKALKLSVAPPTPQGIQKQQQEKNFLMRILKAYIVWTFYQKERKYCYFSGLLPFTQKLIQIMSEENAFWSLIGFAQNLPYSFQTGDEPTSTANSKGHKLLINVVRNILEIKYSEIYKKLESFNIPIEYYFYEEMCNLFSTLFPTKTLLRIYDLIALEAGSEDPLRASWIIISLIILLFTLNKPLIMKSRSAKEVKFIIANTSIHHLSRQNLIKNIKQMNSTLFTSKHSFREYTQFLLGSANTVHGIEYTRMRKEKNIEELFEETKEMNVTIADLISEPIEFVTNHFDQRVIVEGNDGLDPIILNEHVIPKLTWLFGSKKEEGMLDLKIKQVHLLLHQASNIPQIQKGESLFLEIFYEGKLLKKSLLFLPEEEIDMYLNFPYSPGKNMVKITLKKDTDTGGTHILGDKTNKIGRILLDLSLYKRNLAHPSPMALEMTDGFTLNSENSTLPAAHLDLTFLLIKAKQQDDQNSRIMKDIFNQKSINPSSGSTKESKTLLNLLKETWALEAELLLKADLESKETQQAHFHVLEQQLYGSAGFATKKEAASSAASSVAGSTQSVGASGTAGTAWTAGMQKEKAELQKVSEPYCKELIFSIFPTWETQIDAIYNALSNQSTGFFHFQHFFVGIVCFTQASLQQKISMLYEIYMIFASEHSLVLDFESLYAMMHALFQFHLYYVKPFALRNMCRQVFYRNHAFSLYSAFVFNKNVQLEQILQNINSPYNTNRRNKQIDVLLNEQPCNLVDVTQNVRDAFNAYFNLVQNEFIYITQKSIFSKLSHFMNFQKVKLPSGDELSLVIFYKVNKSSFYKKFNFDSHSNIKLNYNFVEGEDIRNYLESNKYNINLGSQINQISKKELLRKLKRLPVLPELMRFETSLHPMEKKMLKKKVMGLSVHLVKENQRIALFNFHIKNDPSKDFTRETAFIKAKAAKETGWGVGSTGGGTSGAAGVSFVEVDSVYTFNLSCVFKQELLSDVKQRIQSAISLAIDAKLNLGQPIPHQLNPDLFNHYLTFYYLDKPMQEHIRIHQFIDVNEPVLFLMIEENANTLQLPPPSNCYAIYRHCDYSYEWLPCFIESEISQTSDYYIKFLHLPRVTMVRNRSQLLFPFSSNKMEAFLKDPEQFNILLEQSMTLKAGTLGTFAEDLSKGQESKAITKNPKKHALF